MDDSSVTDVDRNIPNALFTSVLGLKGPLRIAPHGSEHKPHIILKRVDSPSNLQPNGESGRVARFSFFAHKRFEVKPGKEIMFAVASADGTEGFFKEIALVLEADIEPALNAANEEESNHSPAKKVDTNGPGNVLGLPPKMRKSYTKEKTYTSYISKEHSSSLGFLGYPMNIVPNRVFSSAAVQTDSMEPTPLEVTPADASQPASIPHSNNSPVHLPSPVSADHGREPYSDNFAQPEEDMDDVSRVERSLSPMDLSSPSCSPVHSPFPLPDKPLTPKPNSVVSPFASIPSPPKAKPAFTSTQVFENPEPPPKSPNNPPSDEVSSETRYKSSSAMLEATTPVVISSKTLTLKSATTSTKTFEDSQPLRDIPQASCSTRDEASSTITPHKLPPRVMRGATRSTAPSEPAASCPTRDEVSSERTPPKLPPRVLKGATHSISLSDLFVKATSSVSEFSHSVTQATVESPEVGNKASNGIVAPQKPPLTDTENAFASSSKVPLDNLRKVQPSATLPLPSAWAPIPNPSPLSDPKDVVYIPARSVGNPLGIRPSSNPAMTMNPNQRPLPSGPRSLRTSATATTAKRPVVVGAKWSAVRSSGSISTSANNSAPMTPSSSFSSASTNLTVRPAPKATDLSRILSYGSPSPPPLPVSQQTPSPPQSQSGISKWKRITGNDEKVSASNNSDNSKTSPTSIDKPSTRTGPVDPASSSASITKPLQQAVLSSFIQADASSGFMARSPVKRPLSPSTPNSSDYKKQNDVVMESPSKKVKAELPPSSISKSLASAKVQPEAVLVPKVSTSKPPQPLTHPLPPKPLPIHIGSSYRRPMTSTDWPATYCSVERRLQVHDTSDVGVQKVVFNHDGTQFALICADHTLRIWDNKQPPAEIASLQHTSPIVSVLWMENDRGVITLCQDGRVSTWSRSGNKWIFTKIVTVPGMPAAGDEPMCMVYMKDRIAVSIPTFGVRMWLCISGTWQHQREIIRSGITAIRFVEDGTALIGCCRDGVLWFCEVPNGTLRVHCFLNGKPISLDINPSGSHLLVGDEGGRARLVTLRTNENKGGVEQTYTSPKFQGKRQDFPSVFATKGQAVLHGTLNGCALVWDKRKGTIVYGLKHPEDDPVQAAATFDGRPGVEGWMITGTKQGRLYWWPQPVAAASNHNVDETPRKHPKGG